MPKRSLVRWIVLFAVFFLPLCLLVYRMYDVNLLQGEHFRQLSVKGRTMEVQIPAPRGNIYDRNGVLLAGTRSSFTVQATKDHLMALKDEDRNRELSTLIRLVEQDGADYTEPFPIGLNRIVYASDADYMREPETPLTKAQKLLVEHSLLDEWLSSVYISPSDPGLKVSPAARALTAMSLKGGALPIRWDASKNFELSFVKNEEYEKLLHDEVITDKTTPLELLSKQVAADQNILSETMNHAATQMLAYQVLEKNRLVGDLRLAKSVFSNVESFRLRKAAYHRTFPSITLESSAKQDFTTIVKSVALDDFLQSMRVGAGNKFTIPAESLINSLSDLGVKSNLKYTISGDATSVSIQYDQEETTDEKPLERLKRLAQKHQLIDGLIVDDAYKDLAEKAMFKASMYPGISTKSWTYGLEKNQKDFVEKYSLEGKNPDEAFGILREKYGVETDQDPILAIGVMMLTQQVASSGNFAFWPINLVYELSDRTVAQIEENIPITSGILVSQQPIRYYPFGASGSHVLGYIGKIATEDEIKTFVKKGGYLPNELIGKTGVEQSFEDTLHGVSGTETVRVDARGNRTETVERRDPKAGNNIYLTIDIRLQQQAEKSLKNAIISTKTGMSYMSEWGTSGTTYSPMANSAASVSVDPNNGNLLEMASYPMFDPNLFVTGISASDWEAYQTDTTLNRDAPKPLLNLATQTAVQPGSTFKTIVGLTAVEKGLNPDMSIMDRGFVRIGNRQFNNLYYTLTGGTQGPLNLYDAIGLSNNYYFYILGLGKVPATGKSIGTQVTVDDLQKMVKELGLNQPSGLEIKVPGEAKNAIPSRESKLSLTKSLLKKYLKANLEAYVLPGTRKDEKTLSADIETIVGWAEQGSELSRDQLITQLRGLGYEPEERLEGTRAGLADTLKFTYFNQANWTTADTMNVVIGQGQNAYSPIAMSTVISMLANSGTDYSLTLIKEIRSADNKTVLFEQSPKPRKVNIKASSFSAVREGMRRSAINSEEGFKGLPFEVGSKTGTAQRGGTDPRMGDGYAPYAWNMAFGPFDAPKIATVSFMPAGAMSSNVVPISRDLIASYLEVPAVQKVPANRYDGRATYNPKVEELPEEKNADQTQN